MTWTQSESQLGPWREYVERRGESSHARNPGHEEGLITRANTEYLGNSALHTSQELGAVTALQISILRELVI